MFYPKKQIRYTLESLKVNEEFQNHLKNIKKGRFPRKKDHPIYQSRLVYTQELRKFVYNPAIMNEILSDEELKELLFRTFGYRGSMNFTIYPTAWLRDLTLLDFGDDVYLGDGILLGTNQVSQDQEFITVGKIKIGDRTIIDQKAAIGYGTTIGKDCTLGLRLSFGIRGSLGDNCSIGEITSIGHGVHIGNDVTIGQCCYIGDMSIVDDGVELESRATVPPFSHVTKEGIYHRRTEKKIA